MLSQRLCRCIDDAFGAFPIPSRKRHRDELPGTPPQVKPSKAFSLPINAVQLSYM